MEVPGSGVRKVVMDTADGESTESVVLQCSASEDGEEVARSEPVQRFPELSAKMYAKMMQEEFQESEGDCDEEEVGVRTVVRASQVRAWLTNFADDNSAYWNTGVRVRTRRCKAPKSYSDDGEAFVIERTPVKRKHEEVTECGPVSESELDEGSESDEYDESASSSSCSDASESEYEQSSRRATSNKRRRGGEETVVGSMQLKFGARSRSVNTGLRQGSVSSQQQETANCDNELKEMQLLLELQLKASERREAGMKQRMETMMDMMSRHMGHVEKRVSTLEVGAQPQEQILERINVKLEKVMEGFTTLNENLSILSACLSRDLDSQ